MSKNQQLIQNNKNTKGLSNGSNKMVAYPVTLAFPHYSNQVHILG